MLQPPNSFATCVGGGAFGPATFGAAGASVTAGALSATLSGVRGVSAVASGLGFSVRSLCLVQDRISGASRPPPPIARSVEHSFSRLYGTSTLGWPQLVGQRMPCSARSPRTNQASADAPASSNMWRSGGVLPTVSKQAWVPISSAQTGGSPWAAACATTRAPAKGALRSVPVEHALLGLRCAAVGELERVRRVG